MLKKLLLFFMGLFIIQFGVALFLELNLGSDPWGSEQIINSYYFLYHSYA